MTLQNALGDLNLEETQQDILAALTDERKSTPSGAVRVGTSKSKFRDDFLTFDTTDNWTVIQNPVGQVISVAGDSGGARYLNINSGTNSGDETILLSKQTFKMPLKLAIGMSLSQRIANQSFFLEIVEVDDNGNQVFDTSLFAAPTVKDSRNAASMIFNGTSTTNAAYALRAQGVSELVSGATSYGAAHSVATGTTPNFNAAFQFEILAKTDLLCISSRAVNSAAVATAVVNRTDICPNPERSYAVRIRALNTGVPASATDFRIHFVRIVDASALSVDFSLIGGNNTDMMSAPVKIVQNLSSNIVTGASAAGSTISGNPVRVGLTARTATPTAVTSGQTVDAIATVQGIQITKPYAIPELDWGFACVAGGVTNTTDVTIMALSATLRRYIVGLTLKNVHATTATEVVLKDGTTVIWRGHLPAAMENADAIQFAIPLKTTVNQALNFACLTTGAQVYVSAQGYSAP